MAPLQRILAALCVALLAAGGAGVATHTPRRHGQPAAQSPSTGHRPGASTSTRPTSHPTPPASSGTTSTTVAGPPPPGSAALAAGLVTPTDMGGYYRIVPSEGESLLDSAPCLAVLQPSPAQAGRAVTALLGPDAHSVPTIVEEVASYPGASARAVYSSVVSALEACSSLSFDFGGIAVTSRTAPTVIPPVGDSDRVWSGSFTAGGAPFTIEIGAVLDGQDVLGLIWIDAVPASDPIMGSFTSTVSLAIGKLA